MKPGMKMLMIANRDGDGRRSGGRESERRGGARSDMNYPYYRGDTEYETTRNEYNGSNMNYGTEGRFRGDGRRNNYDNQMNYEMNYDYRTDYDYDDDTEGRYEMARRRMPRDERGRFRTRNEYMGAETNNAYRTESYYPPMPFTPPIYDEPRTREQARPKYKIGFDVGEEVKHDYKTSVEHPQMNEMEHRASPMSMGFARGGKSIKLTKEMASQWMEGLHNEDGTKGPHWTFEQVKQVMAQKGIRVEPLEFYVILNSMYADYCKVFKKYGVGDKLDFYVDMTKAFIEDEDASEGKVVNYFYGVVQK